MKRFSFLRSRLTLCLAGTTKCGHGLIRTADGEVLTMREATRTARQTMLALLQSNILPKVPAKTAPQTWEDVLHGLKPERFQKFKRQMFQCRVGLEADSPFLALRASQAAAMLGVSESQLRQWVVEGKVHKPYDALTLASDWDRMKDEAEAAIPTNGAAKPDEERNPWDEVLR